MQTLLRTLIVLLLMSSTTHATEHKKAIEDEIQQEWRNDTHARCVEPFNKCTKMSPTSTKEPICVTEMRHCIEKAQDNFNKKLRDRNPKEPTGFNEFTDSSK